MNLPRNLVVTAVVAALMAFTSGTAVAEVSSGAVGIVSSEVTEASAVVDAFHAALKANETGKALGFLAEGVMIFEEGGAERSRDEYAAHHLEADASFAAVTEATITRRAGWAEGDVVWLTTEGRTTGLAGDRTIDRLTVETMVLKRMPEGWRIQHIHWSSRAAPEA